MAINEEQIEDFAEQYETDTKTVEQAIKYGWSGPEEFKGDKDRFTKPQDWVERTENIMPIMKATNAKLFDENEALHKEVGATKSELADLKKTVQKVVDAHDSISKREYDKALETIRKEQGKAINENDGDKYQELEAEKDKLEKPTPTSVIENAHANPDEAPEFTEWKNKNKDWFGADQELTDFAAYAENRLNAGGLRGPKLLEEVEAEVKRRYPEKFTNPNRGDQSLDETNRDGLSPPNKQRKTYSALPEDAKRACDKLVAQGTVTKEQYLIDYYEE